MQAWVLTVVQLVTLLLMRLLNISVAMAQFQLLFGVNYGSDNALGRANCCWYESRFSCRHVFTLDSATDGILDTSILDGALVAQAVTEFAQSVSIARGRSANQNETQAGVATIVLNNNDRQFDPINESSPYWDSATNTSGVQPRRFVEIISNGEHLFQGAITAINISYETNFSTCTIEASDDFTRLAGMTVATAFTPSVQISGNRVTTILDLPEVNYPLDERVIETGGKDLQALQIDAGTNVLDYLQQVALADQALLFISKDGNIVYTDPLGTVGIMILTQHLQTARLVLPLSRTQASAQLQTKLSCTTAS
jgi:hypothetical protein